MYTVKEEKLVLACNWMYSFHFNDKHFASILMLFRSTSIRCIELMRKNWLRLESNCFYLRTVQNFSKKKLLLQNVFHRFDENLIIFTKCLKMMQILTYLAVYIRKH